MREIVLDTETTGLKFEQGHRITEIGCIEIFNLVPTGKVFHVYINPERDVPLDSVQITGLTGEFLKDFKAIKHHLDAFLAFIGTDPLVIHNAKFDMSFLNGELKRHGYTELNYERAVCTLEMARDRFLTAPFSLDALCRRFGIDNSKRDNHGALLDAGLLAQVYLELRGGRQPLLFAHGDSVSNNTVMDLEESLKNRVPIKQRHFDITPDEAAKHAAMLKKITNPIWNKYN